MLLDAAALVAMVSTLICTRLLVNLSTVPIYLMSLATLVLAGHGMMICKQPPSHLDAMPLLRVHYRIKQS